MLRMLIKWLIILLMVVVELLENIGAVNAAPAFHSMMNPVEGEMVVTSDFGWRTHPITGTQKFHSGIDLGYDYGMPVPLWS